ncbi:BQ2448_1678 [Microbotryum intermedium]|uniref:BQ2448_1678 protein n=1 Tax=Microbotryum intermedium TaxID=269621 RepID=A0A238FEI0_9BASI|nr:BQ2448_1678 [Microbotryum intermedium]
MSKSYTAEEVAKHNTEDDLWTVINGDVYDLTKFIDMHPGGADVLLATGIAGDDSSEAFFSMHRSEVLTKYQRYKVGRVSNPKTRPYLLPIPGELSPVPMAEPGWLVKEFRTPYFDDSHRRLQREMRKFFDTEVKPEARVNEGAAERPSQPVMELMGSPEWEINAMRMGPAPHLQGRRLPGGIKPEKFTYFHELVVIQELVRVGAPGYMAGLNAGMVIGLPPVLNFGSEKMRKEVLPDILRGKTVISLAISEAAAGSDVQGMTTKATKTADGKYWEVTGNKKWITCGHYSDYFMTGVRTGPGQLSMMLIPRKCETRGDGVDTRIIKTSYSSAAGTAWVTFDKVLVPVENVLGGEGNGLKVILSNFNHERWVICCRIARYSRVIYEETFKWAHLRKVFGKPLIEQFVVRAKFALMLAKIEAGQTWLENLTFQMCNMKYEQQSKMLAGPMALLKYFLSRSQGEIVDEAVQIWGGRGITASGMGVYIEQAQRTYKFDSILGGSEEVLAQLGVRQASKQMPRAVL